MQLGRKSVCDASCEVCNGLFASEQVELYDILGDEKYWRDLEKYLPWKLHGFTYRHEAFYWDDKNQLVQLTGSQKDAILEAIKSHEAKPNMAL